MKYTRCWSEENVKLYFTTESREKNKEIFERTHLPIEKIGVSFSKDIQKQFITEEELRELVTNSVPEDKNRIFLIVGETGCGKSELCQWLEYNITDGIHIPLHISRSDTKIQDIARILNAHLPEEATADNEASEFINLRSDLLAKSLAAELQLELSRDKSVRDNLDRKNLEGIYDNYSFKRKLASDIQEYQQSLAQTHKERGLHVLSRKSFEFSFAQGLRDVDAAYLFTNRTITRVLKEKLKVKDIGDTLKQISEHYLSLKMRPVLLLEDLTSFTFLAGDLIDYLFDLSKGHFDVVIGWTTGFEKAHKDFIFRSPDTLTYMRERLKARFILTDEKDKSTFFLRDTYIELAKKYLSAVKCGKCSMCKDDKDGLYPFNSSILDKIYANLQEDGHPKQTPRLFLEFAIRKVLQNYPDFPWKILASISPLYLKEVPSLIGQKFNDHQDFVDLLKWYGEDEEEHVELDLKIIRWFDLKSPLPPTEDKIKIPMSHMGIALRKRKIEAKNEGGITTEEVMIDFQSWLSGNNPHFANRDLLRKGVIEQIQFHENPCELRNPSSTVPKTTSLFYQRGSLSVPVFIEDSGDDPLQKEYKLVVTREDSHEVLEQLYFCAQGGKIADEFLLSVMEWTESKAHEYTSNLRIKLSEALGVDLEEFVLFSKFLVANLAGKCSAPEVDQIKDNIGTTFYLPNFPDIDLNTTSRELLKKVNEIQSIFASFFNVTSTFFDFLHFSEIASDLDIDKALVQASRIDLRKIPDAYKIGSTREHNPFRILVGIVRNYAHAIEQLPFEDHFAKLRDHLTQILVLIPDNLEGLGEKIENIKKACSILQIPIEKSWIESFDAIRYQDIDFQNLRTKINGLVEEFAKCTDVFQFINFAHEYDSCVKTKEWRILSDLAQIAYLVKTTAQERLVRRESPNIDTVQRVENAYGRLQTNSREFT